MHIYVSQEVRGGFTGAISGVEVRRDGVSVVVDVAPETTILIELSPAEMGVVSRAIGTWSRMKFPENTIAPEEG